MKSNTQLTTKDLLVACQNAKAEGVNSLLIQHNGVNFHVVNAVIVPQRTHSDLTLFMGAPVQKESVNPIKSYLSFLSGTKPNKTPLHKQITPAVIATISQLIDKVDLKTLHEIKTALSEVNEHFENVDNDPNPFSFDLSGGAL